jgi:ABC-type spermidine/putrescine transport system permease subunit I
MKAKIIALVIVTATLLGPFQIAFLYNENYSNTFKTLMFVLVIIGFLSSLVISTLGERKAEH